MERSRTDQIIIIVLILALGLFVEVLKSIRHTHISEAHQQLVLDDDVSPFHISDQQMNADRIAARQRAFSHRGMHLMGQPTKMNSYDFSGGRVVKNKESAKVKKTAKTKKLANKAKTAPAKTTPAIEPLEAQTMPNADSNQAPPIQTNAGVVTGAPTAGTRPAGGAAVGTGNGGLPASGYQQWASQLIPTTSQSTVNEFIQYYQHNLITSGVFYELLDAMSVEPSSNEELFAAYAANATPSAQSFSFLAGALKTDAANSSVVSADDQYLDAYSTLNQVPILKQVFAQSLSNQTTIQIASDILELSTSTYIGSRSPTSTGAPSSASLATAYNGFIPILEQALTVYSSNATIASNLQKSLNLIKTIEPASTGG